MPSGCRPVDEQGLGVRLRPAPDVAPVGHWQPADRGSQQTGRFLAIRASGTAHQEQEPIGLSTATVSTFTWLDHRDEDQERVREALAAFDQPGIVDPLGFGAVRDAFSDLLFPGLSTVQTRARYFLFVPWTYQRLEREGVPASRGLERARALEIATIEALRRGSDDEGVIGRHSRAGTRQLPSFIYWGGLGRWGIRAFAGSRQEYIAGLDRRRQRAQHSAAHEPLWPGLPAEPNGIFEETTLSLTAAEAEFLRDRAVAATRGSYLEGLLRDGHRGLDGNTPWSHPLALEAPAAIREQLHHARLFAYAVQGAELLYNVVLSTMLEEDGAAPLAVDYDERFARWCEEVEAREQEYARWDREQFWSVVATANPRAVRARGFIDWWLDQAATDPRAVRGSAEARRRLRSREAQIKGARAKLANRRARERFPSAQGGALMLFRWPQSRRIIADIHEGLEDRA